MMLRRWGFEPRLFAGGRPCSLPNKDLSSGAIRGHSRSHCTNAQLDALSVDFLDDGTISPHPAPAKGDPMSSAASSTPLEQLPLSEVERVVDTFVAPRKTFTDIRR